MTQLLLPLFLIVISLPLSIPAFLALKRTAPQYNTTLTCKLFRNRFAGLGTVMITVAVAAVSLCRLIYTVGGCSGGFDNKVYCTIILHDMGSVLFAVYYLGTEYLLAIGLPSLCCYVLAEFVTRYRLLKSES